MGMQTAMVGVTSRERGDAGMGHMEGRMDLPLRGVGGPMRWIWGDERVERSKASCPL